LVYTVIGPFVLYHLLSAHLPLTEALLLAGVLPAARTLRGLVRTRRLNLLGVLALLTIALTLVSGLVLKDARLQLLSRALPGACLGLLALASLLTPTPLIMRLVESLRAGASPEHWNRVAGHAPFADMQGMRALFKLLTGIWGVGLLLELAVRVALVYTLPIEQMLLIGPLLTYAVVGSLALVTVQLFRRRRHDRGQETPQDNRGHLPAAQRLPPEEQIGR
jgi:hypothetical protein